MRGAEAMTEVFYGVMRERDGVREWLFYMDPGNSMSQVCWFWDPDFTAADSWTSREEAEKLALEAGAVVVPFHPVFTARGK